MNKTCGQICGITEPRKVKSILKAFGSFSALRRASLDEIKQTGVVPSQVAEDVYAVLRQYNGKKDAKTLNDQPFVLLIAR